MNKKIAITGASGLIGSSLTQKLEKKGYSVFPIKRSNGNSNTKRWSIKNKTATENIFENVDILIHLSGEGIANKRWSKIQKKKILDSRTQSTAFIFDLLKKTRNKPSVFICASGIGIYGDTKNSEINEQSEPTGDSFLKKVCIRWEEEALKISQLGIRVISTRLGMVLSTKGGALGKMLLPFKLGLGGKIGDGQQYVSWISLNDAINAFTECIENESIEGPVNFCSPSPVKNKVFSLALAKALKRPCFFPLPSFVVKLLFGQMGEELLLSSNKAIPKKLQENGFKFIDTEIEETLEKIISTQS